MKPVRSGAERIYLDIYNAKPPRFKGAKSFCNIQRQNFQGFQTALLIFFASLRLRVKFLILQ
jgi:hypothetical protein